MDSERRILTVTALNRFVRNWLEQDIGLVCVEGEISNTTHAASGHYYFTLKDQSAQLKCVFFRNRMLKSTPPLKNGQQILAEGRLSLYEARGDYQLIVEKIEEAGIGELFRAFQLLKTKLAAEGLFDPQRKKAIPSTAHCIGIITSSKGAALHDIMTTLTRRYPLASTKLYASDVQGALAANQLIQAIELANKEQHCDVLILARGGGSLEDLWPFNNEGLAYAIAKSEIPIVTGIGHETDFTIADFVADYRAATPTAAAEKVTPDWRKLQEQFYGLEQRLLDAMLRCLQEKKQRLNYDLHKLASPKRLIQTQEQRLDYLVKQLNQIIYYLINQKKQTIQIAAQSLATLSPLSTLARGYAIATHQGRVLYSHHLVKPGDTIHLQLAEGQLLCYVSEDVTPL
jgi:exodeoxyribonuclease VII large subunit